MCKKRSPRIGERNGRRKDGLNAALDELLKGKKTEEIVGPNGLLKQLTKALLERAMNPEGRGSGNNRNGSSRKTVQGDFGTTEIAVPRDRNGSVEPQILPRHERRWIIVTARSAMNPS